MNSHIDKLILYTLPVGVMVLDAKGIIREVNPAVRALLGKLEGELENSWVTDIFPELKFDWESSVIRQYLPGELELFENSSENVPSAEAYLTLSNKGIVKYRLDDGQERWFTVKLNQSKIEDESNYVLVFSDVTDLKRREMEIVALNQSLENRVAERTTALSSANNRLTQALENLELMQEARLTERRIASLQTFVKNSAHIFNTPLGILTTSNSILLMNIEKTKSLVKEKTIKRSELFDFFDLASETLLISQNQIQLFTELMDSLKRFTFESSSLVNKRVDMHELVNSVNEVWDRGSIQFIGSNPSYLYIQDDLLRLIILELANNAFYHGYDYQPIVQMTVEIRQMTTHTVLTFIDNGSGMTQEVLIKAFEPYVTTERITSCRFGLGLTLVFNIVTLFFNGEIKIDSSEENGCTIEILIPST